MPPEIIISQQMAAQAEGPVKQVAPDATFVLLDKDGVPQGDISNADVYLRAWISPEANRKVIQAAPHLRWMHTFSAGVDHVLTPEIRERSDVIVTNASGVHSGPIAEWVLLYMLSAAKRYPALLDAQKRREWAHDLPLAELDGQTVLIVGMGSIGLEVARRTAGFGLRVWGVQRNPRPEETAGVPIAKIWGDDWRDALPDADYVVIGLPLTPATRHFIGADELARMKKTAWLINIARGEIVDEDALLKAVQNGGIGGAALDAFSHEPLPAGHPFYSTPNIIVTPHIT